MKKTTYPCSYDWEPIPPGDSIVEMMEYHGITQKELAERTRYPVKQINQVILGKVSITPELAILLEQVLGTSAETWNRLEANYQIHKAAWNETEQLRKAMKNTVAKVSVERKKPGRPALPKEQRRSKQITVRFSAEEVARITKYGHKTAVAELVRGLALKALTQ